MRKVKFWLLTTTAVLVLFSIRDKEVVLHTPDTKPLVAEAYSSPDILPQNPILPSLPALALPATSPKAFQQADNLYTSMPSSVDSNDIISFQAPGNVSAPATPNTTGVQPVSTAQTTAQNPAAAQQPIYYGLGAGTGNVLTPIGAGMNPNSSILPSSAPIVSQSAPAAPNSVFITSVNPSSAISATPGVSVVMQGAGFSTTLSENTVNFGSVSASSVTVVSPNQIRAVVPAGLSPGFTDLSVTVNGAKSNNFTFDVLKNTSGNVFINNTQNLLSGAGITLQDSSIVRAVDIDGDKNVDLLVVDKVVSPAKVYLLKNTVTGGQHSFIDVSVSNLLSTIPNIADIVDVEFGDLNGDNFPDMVIIYAGQSPRILFNDGTGKFSDAPSGSMPTLSGTAVKCALGDINGDGFLDIAIVYSDSKDVILLNDGTGKFTKLTDADSLPLSTGGVDIKFSDINSDGSLDVISIHNRSDFSALDVQMYGFVSSGAFQSRTTSLASSNGFNIAGSDIGDTDGDGKPDLVLADYFQDTLLINSDNFAFVDDTSTRLPVNDFHPTGIKFGDLNGDGHLDLVILGENAADLLINDGAGSFKNIDASIKLPDYKSDPAIIGGKNIQLADIDGDGSIDIIVGGASLTILTSGVANNPPVLDHIGNKTVEVLQSLAFNINASDPNGYDLIYSSSNLPSGATFDPILKLFNWTPSADPRLGDVGGHQGVHFAVTENRPGNPLSASEDITITVTSSLPVIDYWTPFDQNQTGGDMTFGVRAHDPLDPSGSHLTYTWFFNGTQIPDITSAGSSFIFIIPGEGQNTIEVRVTNSTGTVSLNWNLAAAQPPVNNPPTISAYQPQDSVIPIDLSTGGYVSFGVTATDPENDSLSYTWDIGGTILSSTTSNLNASAYSGYLTVGDHPITVSVSDGHNTPITHSWTLRITDTPPVNNPPTISAYQPQDSVIPIDLSTGGYVSFGVTATDPENDSLSYTWDIGGTILSSTTSNLNASAYSGYLTVGDHPITVSVSDGHNTPITHSWTLHITDTPPPAPNVLNDISARAFNYFWTETDNFTNPAVDPVTGFIRDRLPVDATNRNSDYDSFYNRASIAATGFGLSAMCVAAAKYGDGSNPDWQIKPDDLKKRVGIILGKLIEIQTNQNPSDSTTLAVWGKDGFFYHYVDIATGRRWADTNSKSEVSSIDTAILISGVLTAGEYFGGDIKDKALQIYRNVNWKAFLDINKTIQNEHIVSNPNYNQMYMSWSPENTNNGTNGFDCHWDYTNEGLLLYILAVSAPDAGYAIPPETFYAFRRELGNYGANGNPMVKSWFGSLFVYQYPQAFFNFKDAAGNALYDKEGVNWWQNSVEATKVNKQFCNDSLANYAGQEDLWGLTSGYTAGFTYSLYGAPPAGDTTFSTDVNGADGTVHPSAAAGSLPLLPDECNRAINKMKDLYDTYGYKVWGDYGFVNSFRMGADINQAPFPISSFYCAIDLGISLVMAENNKSGLVGNNFSGFELAPGRTLKDALIEKCALTTDKTFTLTVDDPNPGSNFHTGRIDQTNTDYTIQFNIDTVAGKPYLLAIHSYLDQSIGNHTVTANIKVNDGVSSPYVFEYDSAKNPSSLMKYIPIDPSSLKAGVNTITIQWQGATNNAKWLAWKNIELSSPVANDTWSITRNETANPPLLFGNEYRVDGTYYAGADIAGFKQALNKDVQNFTDILFYTENTDYATVTFKVLETQNKLKNNIKVFANGSQTAIFDGQVSEGDQVTTSGFSLRKGWNRVTFYHPGVTASAAPSEWIRWDSIGLSAAIPPILNAPAGFVGASFGKDKAHLKWGAVTGAVKYNIYRSTTQGTGYSLAGSADAVSPNPPPTTFEDTGLSNSTPYYYVVRSVKDDGSESANSLEAAVTTGPYQLDYADGHDPNVFGGATLDNSGAPIGDSAFTDLAKYNGQTGKVRKVALQPGQKNTVTLSNSNISDATMVSYRVKGENGGEQFTLAMRDSAGAQAQMTLTVATGGVWQEIHVLVSDFSTAINLSSVASLDVISAAANPITVYFDEAEFDIVALGGDHLDVKIRNRITDELATGLDFGTNGIETKYVTADQYIDIGYRCSGSWNIIINTDNMSTDAYPKFTGTYEPGKLLANGLLGVQNSGYRVPIVWQVFQTKMYTNPGDAPPWGDFYKTGYVVDKSDWDYWKDQYSVPYRTILSYNGDLGFPLDPDRENFHIKGTIGPDNRLYVYLGADFTGAPAQAYTTNKLMVEIYNN